MQAPSRATSRAGWAVAVAATLGMSVSYIDRQTLAAIAPVGDDGARHRSRAVRLARQRVLDGVPRRRAARGRRRRSARRAARLRGRGGRVVARRRRSTRSRRRSRSLFVLRVLLGAAEAPSLPAAAQAIRRALPARGGPPPIGLLFTGQLARRDDRGAARGEPRARVRLPLRVRRHRGDRHAVAPVLAPHDARRSGSTRAAPHRRRRAVAGIDALERRTRVARRS